MSFQADTGRGPGTLVPVPAVLRTTAYHVPRHGAPVDLLLNGNEGQPPAKAAALIEAVLPRLPELLRRYPDPSALQAELAARSGVGPEQVLVTAGGDDALDRLCRAVLAPGRELIFPSPSFEMIARYAALAGGAVVKVPWPGATYPIEEVLSAITPRTAMIAVVSPNNPTGAVAGADDLLRLAAAAPGALLLLDHAYAEFSFDLTQVALSLPRAVVVRTLSKAWGLAGLRVGWVMGPRDIIGWLRVAGAPYAVSGLSLALAMERLREGQGDMEGLIAQVRRERDELTALLTELAAQPFPSQANFVLCRFRDAAWVRDALAGLGIAVRIFAGPGAASGVAAGELDGCLRITCPGHAGEFARLKAALGAALRPVGLSFSEDALRPPQVRDVDGAGLLARLSAKGLRAAVGEAAAGWWRVVTTAADIREARQKGAVPLGLAAPGPAADELIAAGAARVLPDLTALEAMLQ
jgi:histidinol-phosphate aminotransferase